MAHFSYNFDMKQSEIEKKILDFWEKDGTFEKSLTQQSPRGDYVFYDGPPFATGTPHYGHIVASLMKDMVPRYWTMRGYRVERRWGWDCHGLPIENIVEKEHGFKHKKDIEAYGIEKFNEDARGKVLAYVDEWREVITRLGRWVDFDNDYKTMDRDFMESVWWVFKELYDKGLLYEAHRSMHICPRCETTLAQSEVAQGYKDVKDLSVVAKFRVKNPGVILEQATPSEAEGERSDRIHSGSYRSLRSLQDDSDVYLLAWTTTPWTLPGNMALAVGEDIDYVIAEEFTTWESTPKDKNRHPEGIYILSKDILSREGEVVDGDLSVFAFQSHLLRPIGEVKGKELVGKLYKPLFPYYDNEKLEGREHAFKVYAGNDFVNTEEGTGIVHIAPAFGADDYGLSQQEHIPFVQHVHMDGTFKDEVTDFAGLFVKHQDDPNTEDHPENKVEATDVQIVKYLAGKGLLFSKQKIEHSYPHCWRCDSPLLNYSTGSWFVAVEKIKKDILKNAQDIQWNPAHIKDGRFGQWLEGARDWSISRQRFWGSVLPIWVCDKDEKHKQVMGSIAELEKASGATVTDLHKHHVDGITFACGQCDGAMRRIPDVLDCWFESGSMPYAQMHYPFENEKKFKENFPAEFIAEGVDQTRAWFYYLHVLAVALKKKPAFKHVVVNGIVLAEDGKKMSKRLQNYPDPMGMFEKYGADAVRYYLATSSVLRAEDLRFSEKEVEEVVKKVLFITYNVLSFFQMYAEQNTKHQENTKKTPITNNQSHVLDQWIVAKTNQLIKDVTDAYERYDLNKATRPIAEYVNELSTWFVRRSRDRMKDGDQEAIATLKWALEQLSLVMAPVMPFTAEHVWQELGNAESVHLQEWPTPQKINIQAIEKMAEARKQIETGLASRASAGIKIRQPLASVTLVQGDLATGKLDAGHEALLEDELNVGEILYGNEFKLDTELTDSLRAKGNLRELIRAIQIMRKKAGLTPGDTITLTYHTNSDALKEVLREYEDIIKKSIMAKELIEMENNGEAADINGEKIHLAIGN